MSLVESLLNKASVRIIACVAVLGGGVAYNAPGILGESGIGIGIDPRVYNMPAHYEAHRQQQKLFSTPDGRIAYTDHGNESAVNDKVLVLLHGVPTSSWMYRKVIPLLQARLRVASVDLLGYGFSDKPQTPAGVYAPEKQAQRIRDLLAHLNINRYDVLMHDMGGLVAWEMLRQKAPIDNLIVLNTIVRQQGFNNPVFDKGSFTRMKMKAYSNSLSSSMMLKQTFEELGLDTSHPLSEAECRGYVKPIEEGGDVALYEFFTGFNDSFFDRLESNAQFFQQFKGNTLVLWGAQDSILTTDQIPFLQEHLRIDKQNIQIFVESNHFLAEEIPEELAARVLEFVL